MATQIERQQLQTSLAADLKVLWNNTSTVNDEGAKIGEGKCGQKWNLREFGPRPYMPKRVLAYFEQLGELSRSIRLSENPDNTIDTREGGINIYMPHAADSSVYTLSIGNAFRTEGLYMHQGDALDVGTKASAQYAADTSLASMRIVVSTSQSPDEVGAAMKMLNRKATEEDLEDLLGQLSTLSPDAISDTKYFITESLGEIVKENGLSLDSDIVQFIYSGIAPELVDLLYESNDVFSTFKDEAKTAAMDQLNALGFMEAFASALVQSPGRDFLERYRQFKLGEIGVEVFGNYLSENNFGRFLQIPPERKAFEAAEYTQELLDGVVSDVTYKAGLKAARELLAQVEYHATASEMIHTTYVEVYRNDAGVLSTRIVESADGEDDKYSQEVPVTQNKIFYDIGGNIVTLSFGRDRFRTLSDIAYTKENISGSRREKKKETGRFPASINQLAIAQAHDLHADIRTIPQLLGYAA